jgi:S-methylmethionine-dependent homocysteine/selenocysteine methylase
MARTIIINTFKEAKIKGKPLVLDGAIGSYLQQKGYPVDENLWTAKINLSNPEAVIELHKEYIASGADIITTNTFRTNPSALSHAGEFYPTNYVKETVKLAKQAARNKRVLIAGSNAPAEDCYLKQRTLIYNKLEMNHKNHIDLLIDSGVDFILNETQSHFDELRIISEYCNNNQLPYIVSLYFDESLRILSGEKIEDVLSFLKNQNILAVGFNCISPKLFHKLLGSIQLPEIWGFYLNCGSGSPTDKVIHCGIQPEEYIKIVKKVLPLKPSFVGSCCGSNPEHTRKLRDFLDGKNNR